MRKSKLLLGLVLGVLSLAGQQDAAAEGVEMHELKLGTPPQLNFSLVPESRCSFGDLDVMTLDAESKDTVVQLSVEDFGGKKEVYYGVPGEGGSF